MIEIMKASAGSGKTFNLARKYITLLFQKQDRYAYRHILAVTFTNKATDEMKRRILKELYVLASSPEKSGYLKYFMLEGLPADAHNGIDEEDLVKELPGKPGRKITLESLSDSAETVLCNILHDYSAFAVSTIDRFFQQTLKAFSREIGQFASYQVELDKDSLVAESVDRVLDALTESDKGLLKWLTESVMEQIETAGRYSLESGLVSMASRLKSDEHRAMVEELGLDEASVYSKENLSSIRKACSQVICGFTDSVKNAALSALKILHDASVDPAYSNRGFMKALTYYGEVKHSTQIQAPSESFMAKAPDHTQWFSKANAKKYLQDVYPFLEAPLEELCALFGTPFKVYNTAWILRSQLYSLGIAGELYREFNALMKEKNVLSIDDSNTILKDIIDGSDAPFVYEKTGVRFENFLLDEFQDTARIQWENLRPLLHNSEAQGFGSLIVGDVKQSIYRWRGSDWNLFHKELQQEFGHCRNTDLDTNFRSLGGIVSFNNTFFPLAAALLDSQYEEAWKESDGETISSIYGGVVQKAVRSGPEKGSVDLIFCEKDKENSQVLEVIRELHGKGISYGDMAVLVRNNSSGAEVARYLIDNDIDVLTDDSLKVKSSVTVRRIVSLMSYTDNPDDTVSSYLARKLDIRILGDYHSMVDLCESIARKVKTADQEAFDNEILYIQSFMDYVQDYVSVNGNDLHGFLRAWDEADPSICSPAVSDAVRIMSVHKSKGLDFPYVIFPYAENVTLFKDGNHWCSPDLEGTPMEGKAEGLFDVRLSSGSVSTLFAGDYLKELKLQYVDNLNTVYVALTRASEGMVIIGKSPSGAFLKKMEGDGDIRFSDFSQIFWWFAGQAAGPTGAGDGASSIRMLRDDSVDGQTRFSYGEIMPPGNPEVKAGASPRKSGYPSWPLNAGASCGEEEGAPDSPPGERGRLKLSPDAYDFFSSEGKTGAGASMRIKGIVLHDILSRVTVPSDLERSVEKAVFDGDLGHGEADSVLELLSARIAGARGRGWFPDDPSGVSTEVTLIDSDGRLYRPDRVVIDGGRVSIVDYKFGEHDPKYGRQIAKYADIYRRMGYRSVTASLWYVMTDQVE